MFFGRRTSHYLVVGPRASGVFLGESIMNNTFLVATFDAEGKGCIKTFRSIRRRPLDARFELVFKLLDLRAMHYDLKNVKRDAERSTSSCAVVVVQRDSTF